MDSVINFLQALPTPVWTLLGVLIGGIVTLRIESIKLTRRRRAISQVLFARLHSLISDINNLFVGGGARFPFLGRPLPEDEPYIILSSLFSQSTLPAYRVSRSLVENLFTQEKHITGVSWIFSKLEVAEALRQRCVDCIDDRKRFIPAWYQYCISLRGFSGGSTQYLMTLFDLSYSPFRRILLIRKRQRIKKELTALEGNIEKAFGDFPLILSTRKRKQ